MKAKNFFTKNRKLLIYALIFYTVIELLHIFGILN